MGNYVRKPGNLFENRKNQSMRHEFLKMMQDADAIIADCRDLIAQHGLDAEVARNVVIKGMLADQPLPLAGAKA